MRLSLDRIVFPAVVALAFVGSSFALDAPGLPTGVVNTQDPKDKPIRPEEAVRRMTLPEGFSVSLFAGEPNVMQPIAFDFDDRGRLWVVECFSYPDWSGNISREESRRYSTLTNSRGERSCGSYSIRNASECASAPIAFCPRIHRWLRY